MSESKFAGLLSAARESTEAPQEESKPAPAKRARTAVPASTQEPTPKKIGRPAVGKRSNAEYEQVSLYLRKETHTAAKIRLLQDGDRRDLSEVMEELLAAWLKARR